ncbi:uncharacterized protein LOC121269651 isoform X1 [Carcharodon carcharias]|uniref:uncharacterized protein LOC121269651 isoform X1 n=1 Tax=Carcharodon carcharias TaxID=13397 RepID=UPI001B7EDDDF|nr:uncharacterized protein LOC121269651 isoform X1 [Carcharodon carcharias]XP_041030353.1 uncharacterized protein LOC121269651 isoform X1 [Carcharodon carcharias]
MHFCPEETCPPDTFGNTSGYYCTASMPRLPCPAGYYCPEGSGAPVECPVGHYCPQDIVVSREGSRWVIGAIKPVKCPLGYREYVGSNRSTFNSTCEPCPAGYYGNHTDRQVCLECQAGVVCLQGATTTDPPSDVADQGIAAIRSYVCPKGHYCLKASPKPIPCLKGTYNPSERAVSADNCLKCPTNYFDHLTGQIACFSCGPQAVQPEEGQDICICLQNGEIFQPSDSHCTCALRHRVVSKGTRACVRQQYDICREGTSRNQDGTCLAIDEWKEYCSLKVCASPVDYQGFDEVLGLCLCRTESLDSVCNRKCRWLQWSRLQIAHKGGAHFRITDRNGLKVDVPLSHVGRVLNSRNAIEESQSPPQYGFTQPVHLVETSEKGFLGVYDPDPKKLKSLLEMNLDQHPLLNESPDNVTLPVKSLSSDDLEAHWSRIRQFADSSINGTSFSGIFNPTTCINIGSIIIFIVSSGDYPVYDIENLYNTNNEFDWGAFRGLAEEIGLNSSTSWLFSYRFSQPGVHVFQLNSNPNKKMYIQVMPVGGQCYEEGPFFPTTPRNVIRTGIGRAQDLWLKPDWLLISSLLITSVIVAGVCAGLLLLFRNCNWPEKAPIAPIYRTLHKAYNFDDYSSKGAAVIAVKKFHRSLRFKEQTEENEEDGEGGEDSILKNDEFWDYEQQIDLEFFNTNTFYQILLKQSLAVSVRLSQHKNEVKILYQKIAKETDSLRELWMERMNFAGRRLVINKKDMEIYEKMCHKIRLEIERRKHIGVELEEILNKQQQLLHSDWSFREEHQITFNTALREAVRLLEQYIDNNEDEKTLLSTRDHQR